MVIIAIANLLACILAYHLGKFLSVKLVFLYLTLAIIVIFLLKMNRYIISIITLFTLAVIYTTCYLQSLQSWTLASSETNTPVIIVGNISSLPISTRSGTQFYFYLESLQGGKAVTYPKSKIKLYWPHAPSSLHAGDKWQMVVKLKQIHGLHNPGSFNYEVWSMERGLRAIGVVVNDKRNVWVGHAWYMHIVEQLRQFVFKKINETVPSTPASHWIIALAIGERSNISDEQWQVLRRTGTNHLMAIGGLHIGMLAAFIHLIASWCWRWKAEWLLILPAQEAGALAALVASFGYALLSGFSIPAERACLMMTVYVVALLSRQRIAPINIWAMALMTVLIINPLSFLSDSFWLSFGTIALIVFGMSGRLTPSTLWWKWGRVQWVITIGLLPLSLYLFNEWSLLSFIANAIAIPWLTFIILPCCLSGVMLLFISQTLAKYLLLIAAINLNGLWWVLSYIASLHTLSLNLAIPNFLIFILAIGGTLMLIAPIKASVKWYGVVWLLPLFLYKPISLPLGQAKLTLLDVGQGLSAVIQTHSHVLVFDTGSGGANVVVPFLRAQFIKAIDVLVVSHGDEDHIGGVKTILENISVKNVLTSVTGKFPAGMSQLCLAGVHWQWDKVTFQFIYPFNDTLQLGNDSSCVLRIDAGKDSVLIPGDIEKFAEIKILERVADKLNVTVLIAPHHGSHTSSMPEFIRAVYPRYVLYPVGFNNRYHFPHADVVSAYQQLGVESYATDIDGAVQATLGGNLLPLFSRYYSGYPSAT